MAAALFFLPFPVAHSSDRTPAAGARLHFYLSGTLTPVDVYTTDALTIAHSNPVVANGAGRFPTIYTDDADVLRLIIKDADGDTLDDIDPYIPGTAGSPGTSAEDPVFTVATGAAGTDVTISGTYPNKLLTIPRGLPGASGALTDAVYGDITVSGTGSVLTIGNKKVSYAKIQDMAAMTFLGNPNGSLGASQAISVAGARTLLSITNVDDTSDANKPVSTAQAAADATKQPLTPREQLVASSATVTPTFLNDQVTITAQAAALALANPTGAAVPNHGMVIRIKDSGTARAITYDTQYRALGVTLPTTTIISKTLYLGMIWNATDSKFDVVSVAQQA